MADLDVYFQPQPSLHSPVMASFLCFSKDSGVERLDNSPGVLTNLQVFVQCRTQQSDQLNEREYDLKSSFRLFTSRALSSRILEYYG